MGLFSRKPKDEKYEIELEFDTRATHIDDFLTVLFATFKNHGMSLVSEPDIETWDSPFVYWVTANFTNGVRIQRIMYPLEEISLVKVPIFREPTSSVSEDELATAVLELLGANLKTVVPHFRAGVYKYKGSQSMNWEKVLPRNEHKSFM